MIAPIIYMGVFKGNGERGYVCMFGILAAAIRLQGDRPNNIVAMSQHCGAFIIGSKDTVYL